VKPRLGEAALTTQQALRGRRSPRHNDAWGTRSPEISARPSKLGSCSCKERPECRPRATLNHVDSSATIHEDSPFDASRVSPASRENRAVNVALLPRPSGPKRELAS